MRWAVVTAFLTVLAGAYGQDIIVLQSGATENCRVVRFSAGRFACEMPDGSTNQVLGSAVREISFGNAPAIEAGSGGDLKGRFYLMVGGVVKLYVNGTLLHEARWGNSFTDEIDISPGDTVVAELTQPGGASMFKLAFLTSDRRSVVNFRASDFRDLGIQPIADLKPEAIKRAQVRAQKLKDSNKGGSKEVLLPDGIKDRSDAVWGSKVNCLLGASIAKEMITPIRQ